VPFEFVKETEKVGEFSNEPLVTDCAHPRCICSNLARHERGSRTAAIVFVYGHGSKGANRHLTDALQ
jgi:hypothetical protein